MTDPVSTTDGHVYQRFAIEDWLKCADLFVLRHQGFHWTLIVHVYLCSVLESTEPISSALNGARPPPPGGKVPRSEIWALFEQTTP